MVADDAIWLVWYDEHRKRYVYPCSVLQVLSSCDAASSTVLIRFYQDNGIWDEPGAVILRMAALVDEDDVRDQSRLHLDWAYRTTSMPGENNDRRLETQPPTAARRLSAPSVQGGEGNTSRKRSRAAPAAETLHGDASGLSALDDVIGRLNRCEELMAAYQAQLNKFDSHMTELRGRFDAWDTTLQRMQDYQRQQAMMAEELRKLKIVAKLDAGPSEAADPPQQPVASSTDPLCMACKAKVAYDMPLRSLMTVLVGDPMADLQDLFSLPGGRVKAASPLKMLVQCDACMPTGALKLVVCTSGGAGNRLTCDWCRCRMTKNTTDATSMWCGKKHSNCRTLVIENETDRQGNSLFLSKGLAPVKEVVPWDDVKLIDVGLEQYNEADYVVVASSSLGKALVIIEIDNMSHAGGQYTPESEKKKNDGNFACAAGFDRVLFVRINPSGAYSTPEGAKNMDKKARWLIARDWIVTFLRAPYGSWAYDDRLLLYLFYDHTSPLLDRRPAAFTTVLAYQAPALPEPRAADLADWACSLDPYLMTKGSTIAQEGLALSCRLSQPARAVGT